MIWVWFLCCALLVFFVLLLPTRFYFFSPPGAAVEQEKQRAVHRETLQRFQQDLAQGLVATDDASVLRNEAARRLLQDAGGSSRGPLRRHSLVFSVLAAVAIIVLTAVAYLKTGQPNYTQRAEAPPDVLTTSAVDGGPSTGELIAKLSQHLKNNPRDLQGWTLLGDTYGNAGKFPDAAKAYGRALALKPPYDIQAELYARRGEAFVLMSDGLVPETAKFDIARALEIDPSQPVARYYQGLAFFQSGRGAAGLETWSKLYDDLSLDTAWRDQLQREIEFAKALMEFKDQ